MSCSEGCMNNDPRKSAQPCGCDEGADYKCRFHSTHEQVIPQDEEIIPGLISPSLSVVWDNMTGSYTPTRATTLPTDPAERKKYPVATGFVDYFPDAIVAVAHVSWVGNNQHNPGQPLHWARGKSMDQDDTTMRHFLERGGGNVSGYDVDRLLHRAKHAWRSMAALQLEIEDLKARGLYPPKEGQ